MNLLQKHVNANTWRYLEFGKKTQRGLNLLSGKNGLTKSVGDIAIGVIKTAIKNDWQSINQTYGWLEVCENHIVNVWQQFIIRSDVTLILTSTFRSDCSRIKSQIITALEQFKLISNVKKKTVWVMDTFSDRLSNLIKTLWYHRFFYRHRNYQSVFLWH